MDKKVIELADAVCMENDVNRRIRTTGVKGLDFQRAKELGFFQRISYLLCAMHTTVMSAYRIYGGVAKMLYDFGSRKNDIAKAMSDFENAYTKFSGFWTDYYAHGSSGVEVNHETETLFHNIMRWMQIPEHWSLGDPQRLEDPVDVSISIEDEGERVLHLYKSVVNEEVIDSRESWCVTEIERRSNKQTCVEENLDKGTALMVAKRMSNDNKSCIYTCSQVVDIKKSETVITPFRAFSGNEVIGRTEKNLKQ